MEIEAQLNGTHTGIWQFPHLPLGGDIGLQAKGSLSSFLLASHHCPCLSSGGNNSPAVEHLPFFQPQQICSSCWLLQLPAPWLP